MKLEPDLREFIKLLNARDVRYLVVGAYALAYHGRPRYTGDIDFFVQASEHNAGLVAKIIAEFGFASLGIVTADLTTADQVIQLGVEPNRIDIMNSITGVSFDEAWLTREYGEIDGVRLPFISKELLKRNKAAVGRKQDLADLDYL
ncbi:MAG: nucleotidyltransferase [Pyrinomonadaceae bacterium]